MFLRLPGIREWISQRHLGMLQIRFSLLLSLDSHTSVFPWQRFPVYIAVMCPSRGQEVVWRCRLSRLSCVSIGPLIQNPTWTWDTAAPISQTWLTEGRSGGELGACQGVRCWIFISEFIVRTFQRWCHGLSLVCACFIFWFALGVVPCTTILCVRAHARARVCVYMCQCEVSFSRRWHHKVHRLQNVRWESNARGSTRATFFFLFYWLTDKSTESSILAPLTAHQLRASLVLFCFFFPTDWPQTVTVFYVAFFPRFSRAAAELRRF